VVGTIGRSRKVFETSVIAAANVCFRDVMAAAENSLRNAGKVDFDVIKTGGLTDRKLVFRFDADRLPPEPGVSPAAGALQLPSLFRLGQAFGPSPVKWSTWL
jgi:hypothetical protein